MILTKSQAEAVYSAMCALNNVNARCMAELDRKDFLNYKRVVERDEDTIYIVNVVVGRANKIENYDNQAAFAAAYGVA